MKATTLTRRCAPRGQTSRRHRQCRRWIRYDETCLPALPLDCADPRKAKKLLREFPSVGEPYADRILLFAGSQVTLAPDSNALRVLARLGFVREEKSYSKMYRAAVSATTDSLENAAGAQRAHLLLRKHGQELCKRSAPRSDLCPLRAQCVWYGEVSRP